MPSPGEPDWGYAPPAGHFNETTLLSGEARAEWRRLLASLDDLGAEELARRWREAERLIRENGVTYNVYSDPQGMDRPWQLDPIPLLIPETEWAAIEAAVTQRAHLLDRTLADLYGPQRLLRDGHIPAELVLGHPGFLRACHGVRVPHDRYLHLYAADLARSPDGQWWVIGDRAQAPSGAGYALENRVVLSRVLPEPFRDFHVRRLASWFQSLRDGLADLSPRAGDEAPRVVLLTPGPYNETYFEHAYLARYLGLTLVEGADLTVRDERVHLKTLDGLSPVDVILRRQDDVYCDPLELLGESALGVPGLVQAVRAGNVAIANALGSGLLETSATMAFLPGLCRHLLGEELRMPSVATWWCGQTAERDAVIAGLERLVLKPTFPRPGEEVVFGDELDEAGRAAWAARLRAEPTRYLAQERIALSSVPSASADGPVPRHLVLRVFAAAHRGSWTVMPGGLTRVSTAADSLVVSSQRGGGSKDTWVLSRSPVPYVTLMDRATGSLQVSRAGVALTSRVASNLLWLGRGSERVEASVRLFRAALRRLAAEPLRLAGAPLPEALRLLISTGRLGRLSASESTVGLEEHVLAALFDRARPESLGASVGQLHRLTWPVRDRLSPDAWRVLARLDQELVESAGLHPALRVSSALDLLDRAVLALAAFTGLVMESMTHALGWRFLDLGRRLERAIQAVELLHAGLVEPSPRESRRLETLLEVADGVMTYRSRYQTSVQTALVLDLLLRDEANPRSVAHQLVALLERFTALEKAPHAAVAGLLARVREAPADALAGEHDGHRAALEALLDELARGLPAAFDELNHAYLVHAVPRRRSGGSRGAPAP